ncbi:MAG: replication-associated recombination protein A [Spirochaetia bacterium]|nr:replication-associated recombination protein A [Spirochaetia bacterium]
MQDSLFTQDSPLPHRLRPSRPEDFFGNAKLLERLMSQRVHSMILYGPPGCGKTTLATMIAEKSGLSFVALSAVSSGVKEVREAIDQGKKLGKLVLFIDEIHRFSKAQQDAMLHAVESGWIVLIGATTENPSFEVINALLSRCQVYRLEALSKNDLEKVLARAIATDPFLKNTRLTSEVADALIDFAAGDARKMLQVMELAVGHNNREITRETLAEITSDFARRYDRAGDNHYDFISAFIKSMRGSDPDAALLYMACMIDAGEDPLFIARRMVIFAAEDIGNAVPQALQVAVAAFQALERIGMPEGRIILAQAATFLASSPKSNASYRAINSALKFIDQKQISIPNHLRNAPTETQRKEGAGQGYKYPHDFPEHFVQQDYMPQGMNQQFYEPTDQGHESRLKERLRSLGRNGRKY